MAKIQIKNSFITSSAQITISSSLVRFSDNIRAKGITGSFSGSFAGSNLFVQGGNSFGTTALLGTNDNQALALETNGSEKLRVTSAGNVGIGTSNPIAKLHTVGSNGSTDYVYQQWSYISNVGVYDLILKQTVTSNVVRYNFSMNNASTAYNDVLVLDRGCVGIGTSFPLSKLDVRGTMYVNYGSNGTGYIQTNGTDSDLQITTATNLTTLLNTGTSGAMAFGAGNSERMRILSGGNIGIGTTSPADKLEVDGGVRLRSGNSLTLRNATNDSSAAIYNVGGSNGSIISFAVGPTPTMYVGSNVGIGTTNASAKLTLNGFFGFSGDFTKYIYMPDIYQGTGSIYMQAGYGSALAGGAVRLYGHNATTYTGGDVEVGLSGKGNFLINSYIGGTRLVTVKVDGNVGIGTTTPTQKLEVAGYAMAGESSYRTSIYGNASGAWIAFGDTSNTVSLGRIGAYNSLFNINSVNGDTSFQYNGSEKMRITTGGNVGIGTSSPAAFLDIVGNGIQTILRNTSATSYTSLRLYNNQNSAVRALEIDYAGASYSGALVTNGPSGESASIGTTGAYPLTFATNNTARMTISGSAGYVGIGTITPNKQLTFGQINDDAIQIRRITVGSGGPSAGTGISWTWTSSTTDNDTWAAIRAIFPGNSDTHLTFATRPTVGTVTERMRIQNDGNVGIGTTAPLSLLDVRSGFITAGTNSATAGTTIIAGYYTSGYLTSLGTEFSSGGPVLGYAVSPSTSGTGAFLSSTTITIPRSAYVQDGGTHRWYTGAAQSVAIGSAVTTSEKMRMDTNGNIGIGTTSPGYKLDVNGTFNVSGTSTLAAVSITGTINSNATETIRINNNNGYISYYNSAGTTRTGYLQGNTGNAMLLASENGAVLQFAVGGSEVARITTTGNVGIGTTSPTAKLQVGTQMYGSAPDANYFVVGNENFSGPGPVGGISGYPVTANKSQVTASLFDVIGGWERINASHALLRVSAYDVVNSTPALTVLNNGNVGMGTNSPVAKLHITGSSTAAVFYGNVGIGTSTFSYPTSNRGLLEIFGSAEALIALRSSGTNFYIHKPGVDCYIVNTNSGFISIYNNGSERMRIASDGNIGIGTSNPVAKLQIVDSNISPATGNLLVQSTGGNASIRIDSNATSNYTYFTLSQGGTGKFEMGIVPTTSDLYINPNVQTGATNAAIYIKKADGNIGIGTTSPTTVLQVVGTGTGTIGTVNIKGSNAHLGLTSAAGSFKGWYGYFNSAANGSDLDLNIKTGYAGASNIRIGANGDTTQLFISGSGNLGVGTTTPFTRLNVYRNGVAEGTVSFEDETCNAHLLLQGADARVRLQLGTYNNGSYGGWIQASYDNSPGGSGNSGVEPLILNPQGGNVGIGTTNPGYRLDVVSGSMRVSSAAGAGEIYFGTIDNANLYLKRDNNYDLSLVQNASSGNALYLAGAGNVYVSIDSNNNETDRAFIVQNNSVKSGTELFRVNEAGNVGIGTSSPKQKLDVSGAGGKIAITNTGNTDYAELVFYEGSSVKADIWVNGSAQATYAGVNSMNIWQGSNAPMAFYTNGTNERMRISADGNVGIGTSTSVPSPLTVYNNADVWHFRLGSSTGELRFGGATNNGAVIQSYTPAGVVRDLYIQRDGGNVGIGTNAPVALLDVRGNTKFGSSLSNTHQFTGSVNFGGSTYNNSIAIDKFEYFSLQPYIEGGSFPSNVFSLSGTFPTFVTMTGSVCPFGKVAYNVSYYEAIGDFIPVQAGETLYGEIWAYRSAGATGTAGVFYCGIARYDKDKRAIDGNAGLNYFIVQNATVPSNSTWTKYSNTTTLPLTHTPYAGSDGGPVRYVRPYIIVNYTAGTVPTYWAAFKIRKQQLTRDLGAIVVSGSMGIGTSSPSSKLHIYENVNRVSYLAQNNNHTARFEAYGTATAIDTSASNGIFYRINGSDIVKFAADGNVGIGTSSPTSNLHVYRGAASANVIALKVGDNTNTLNYIPYTGAGGYNYASIAGSSALFNSIGSDWWIGTHNGAAIRFVSDKGLAVYNNVTTAISFYISGSGNVGIGTTNPVSKFVVNGGTVNTTTYTSSESRIADGSIHLMKTVAGGVFESIRAMNADTTAGTTVRFIAASTSDPFNNANGGKVFIDAIRTSTNMDLAFSLNDVGGAAPVERVRFMGSGCVGIGTSSPSATLTVIATNNTGSRIQLGTASTSAYMDANKVNDFMVMTAPYGASPASVSNGGAKWGIKLNGSIDTINTKGKAACIYAVSEENSAGYNRMVGLALHTSAFDLDNAERMRISANGSVGIGTTGPISRLDIRGSHTGGYGILNVISTDTSLLCLDSTGARDQGIRLKYNGVDKWLVGLRDSNDAFSISNGSDTRLVTVLQNGCVGIGTTSPAYRLDVNGGIASGGVLVALYSGNYNRLYEPAGNPGIYLGNNSDPANYYDNGTHFFRNRGGSSTYAVIEGNGNLGIGTTSVTAPLHIYRASNPWVRLNGGGNYSYIRFDDGTSNGYLFKNTSSDTSNGALAGAMYTYTDSGKAFQHIHSGTPLFTILSGGNVGVGTTTPLSKLNSYGSGSNLSVFRVDGGNGTLFEVTDQLSGSLFSVNDVSGLPLLEVFSNNRVVAGKYGSNALVVSGSSVGIGTTTPAYKLQVNGSFAATTKSFVIKHPDPAKSDKQLVHGVTEGPEHSVFVRGNLLNNNIIQLPDYWQHLVDADTITVTLTPNKYYQQLYVKNVTDTTIEVGSETDKPINCYYYIVGERKDIPKLITEI